MIALRKDQRRRVDAAAIDLFQIVGLMIEKGQDHQAFQQLAIQADVLLESLPVGTTTFDLAKRRLQNAVRYRLANEVGAAQYELRMLSGSLRSILQEIDFVKLDPTSNPDSTDSDNDHAKTQLPGPPTSWFPFFKKKRKAGSKVHDLQSS